MNQVLLVDSLEKKLFLNFFNFYFFISKNLGSKFDVQRFYFLIILGLKKQLKALVVHKSFRVAMINFEETQLTLTQLCNARNDGKFDEIFYTKTAFGKL